MKSRQVPVIAVLVAALLLREAPLPACTETHYGPEFTPPGAPDDLEAYANGHLGVIGPRYARSYLYAAYRYLEGRPFSGEERTVLSAYWQKRATGIDSDPTGSPGQRAIAVFPPAQASGQRRPVRKRYYDYLNCGNDAYRAALDTFDEKIARHGQASRQVQTWLLAQRQVFANCGGGRTIPAALGPEDAPAERADREYQIAAAHFYAEEFEEAEVLFRRIAADPVSRWRGMAPYLAARCLVRRGTLPQAESGDRFDFEPLRQAQKELEGILADSRLRASHAAAESLLTFVRFKTEPARRLDDVSKRLREPVLAPILPRELTDYTRLLDRLFSYERAETFEYDRSRDDLTDWIAAVQDGLPTRDHAVERWHAKGGDPWLIAVLMTTRAADPLRDEILQAAGRLDPGSPGFATASYHRLRLLCQSGALVEARRLLATLAPERQSDWSQSTKNAFTVFEISLATRFSEFLDAAARRPANDLREPQNWPVLFTPAGRRMLDEEVPIRRLLAASQYERLDASLRAELALVAWSRAVLSRDYPESRRAARQAAAIRPSLEPVFREYLSLTNESDLRFEAARIELADRKITPHIRTGDPDGDLPGPGSSSGARVHAGALALLTEPFEENSPGVPLPRLFPQAEISAAAREQAAIAESGSQADHFCREAIRRARSRPKDPRVPETLYGAIQTTRLTSDPETSAWSQRAFATLHRLYPKSPWAKKAKYWF